MRHTANYRVRYMTNADIPQVLEIDRQSFSLPWSVRSYHFEVNENATSHMIALTQPEPDVPKLRGLRKMLRRMTGKAAEERLIGYGGFWLIEGEHHVSTIAVAPEYRGKRLGELLLALMLLRGIRLYTEYSILEVRVSNTPAIRLYTKYGYEVIDRRKGYYRDNNEDAHLMMLKPVDEAYQLKLNDFMQQLQQQISFRDEFTNAPIPVKTASP